MTTILDNTTIFKNSKEVTLPFFSVILQFPKKQGKYSNFRGKAVPDEDCEKYLNVSIMGRGCSEGALFHSIPTVHFQWLYIYARTQVHLYMSLVTKVTSFQPSPLNTSKRF